ncbi:MAG: ATP-binding cassette domain-containing protein [Actinomycetota bacterium]
MSSSPLLELENVRRVFPRRAGIWQASLRLAPGEVVALVGPNGCGKSTLLRLAAGVLRPASGRVWRAPAATLGWSEEEPRLQAEQTVGDYLATFGALRGVPRRTVQAMAERWGVGDADVRCGALSRGQRRRVALVRAFLGNPPLLLLDEPLSGLDREWRDDLWGVVLGNAAKKRATALTLHTLEEAADIPRTVLVWGGRVVFDGPTAEADERTGSLMVATFEADVAPQILESAVADGCLVAWRSSDRGFEALLSEADPGWMVDRLRREGIDGVGAASHVPFLTQVRHAA